MLVSISPVFAGAQPVVDSPANVKLQTIIDWLNNFLVYHFDYYNSSITTKLNDIANDILAVGGQTSDVSSKLITTNNYLSSIDSKTIDRNYTSYIDDIETSLNNLETINWIDTGLTLIRIQNPFGEAITQYNTTLTYDYLDFIYPITSRSYNNIYKFNLPFAANAVGTRNDIVDHIEFIRNGSVMLSTDVITEVSSSRTYVSYYFGTIPTSANNNEWTLRVYVKRAVQVLNATPNILTVQHDTLDDMLLSYRYYLSSMQKNIDNLAEIYASDDVIQAKQNQQSFENQAINDFTGNGNNSASLNDLGSVSNISFTVKNGLNAGGSISGGLSVFDANNSDFWGWFSQSNYNEINGIQNRRLLNNNEYYDYVTDNQVELERLLNKYD